MQKYGTIPADYAPTLKRYAKDEYVIMQVGQLVRNMREGYLEHRQLTTWVSDNKILMIDQKKQQQQRQEEETETETVKNNANEFLEDFKRFNTKKRQKENNNKNTRIGDGTSAENTYDS